MTFIFVTKVLTMSHAGPAVDAVLTSPLQEGPEVLPDAIAIPQSPVPESLGSGSVGMLFFACLYGSDACWLFSPHYFIMHFVALVTGSSLPSTPQQTTEGSYAMLEVEWPQEPPRRVRHPDSVSAVMFSGLQTFLEQQP